MSTNNPSFTGINVHRLPSLRLKVFWAITLLTTKKKDRFFPKEISDFLVDKVGVNTSRQAVEYVLKRSAGSCNKNNNGYKLMQKGMDELSNTKKIVYLDSNKSFSIKNFELKNIVGDNYKNLSICDPYLDVNTLDVIFKNFKKGVSIRLLTSRVLDKPSGIIKRQLAQINREGFSLEIRVEKNNILHDRYIISDKNFWLVGSSLNYLGNKESFIILLGADIQRSMLNTFNNHWSKSSKL